MKKILFLTFCFCICITISAVGITTQEVSAKQLTMSWVSFIPKNNPETASVQNFLIDKINEATKGELVINYRGGPEVMAGPDMASAVQKGVVDICSVIPGWYEAIVPSINSITMSNLSPEEQVEPGEGKFFDFVVKQHQKHGLMYLGNGSPSDEPFFYQFLNKKVEKPEDYKNLKLGSATAPRAAAIAWGSSVTNLKLTQYYTAMERNLVDGVAGTPLHTWVAFGAHEVTKYVVDHPYYNSPTTVIMNLKSWNKLSKSTQEKVIKVVREFPKYSIQNHKKMNASARKAILAKGVEFYKFSPDVEKWFIDTAYEAGWAHQMERFPKETPKMKELFTK